MVSLDPVLLVGIGTYRRPLTCHSAVLVAPAEANIEGTKCSASFEKIQRQRRF